MSEVYQNLFLVDGRLNISLPRSRYAKFWKQFGSFIKLGALENDPNTAKLIKLMRWQSSADAKKETSLDGVWWWQVWAMRELH